MSKEFQDSGADYGQPNPIVNAAANAIAALRADADQLELAKAHESLGPLARRVSSRDVGAALPPAHHFGHR